MIDVKIEEITSKSRTMVSGKKTTYKEVNSLIVPDSLFLSHGENKWIFEMAFNEYDNRGNILEMTPKDGIPKSYLWAYDSRYPVAEVVGKRHNEIESLVDTAVLRRVKPIISDTAVLSNQLRQLYNQEGISQVNTFTYTPFGGIWTHTPPNKNTAYYEYDSLDRLIRIKDGNKAKLSEYVYQHEPLQREIHYWKDLSFANAPLMKTYNLRFNCDNNSIAIYNYIYPGGQISTSEAPTDQDVGFLLEPVLDANGLSNEIPYAEIDENSTCQPISSLSKITFHTDIQNRTATVFIDFVQGDNTVATKIMIITNYNNTNYERELYIPPGTYKVVLRSPPPSYSAKPMFCRWWGGNSTIETIRSQDITLEAGKSYGIGVMDTY